MKTIVAFAFMLVVAEVTAAPLYNIPAINGEYTIDASVSMTNDLSGVGIFTNPNSADVGTVGTYYAGTIQANYALWQAGFKISLIDDDGVGLDGNVVSLGNQRGNANWGYWVGAAGTQINLTPLAGGDLDFVIKLSNDAWNKGFAEIFIGANATNATEGTADVTVSNLVVSFTVDKILVEQEYNSAGGAASITNFTVSDEWVTPSTPVDPDPEPPTNLIIVESGVQTIQVYELIVTTTDAPGAPQNLYPISTQNAASGPWTDEPHSDNPYGPFVVTNLTYSDQTSGDYVFYVQGEGATKTFGLDLR
ncbi:hypothetical protein PDESU_05815 [Pontiella desulfatans]|uniref:Uncharacterized protein n=1 Tax=Pontiella desulfatans TaxID=2750659 RepID=A0A6C2UBA6_PONDE|nr:hypothetical protein [Pontiella desulfatans]VGO17219.1 hypothetical protein PDESU_05815 [Pontiella desulfatans]